MLFGKTKSPIRDAIYKVVDQKIVEAENEYTKQCELADLMYEQTVESAAKDRDRHKDGAEKHAVDSVIGKLFSEESDTLIE